MLFVEEHGFSLPERTHWGFPETLQLQLPPERISTHHYGCGCKSIAGHELRSDRSAKEQQEHLPKLRLQLVQPCVPEDHLAILQRYHVSAGNDELWTSTEV